MNKDKSELQKSGLILESAPDAMVVVNKDGEIQLANRQMVALLGYTNEELLTMNVDDFVPSEYRTKHAQHRDKFASEPRVRGMGEAQDLFALTKTDQVIPIEVSLSPIPSVGEGMVVAAIRDVSARKAVEHALKESQEQLREARDLAESATAAKSRFLAAASHDLRQPLQALRLYLSALANRLEDEKATQLSEKMHLSLDTMGHLLEALLDISMLESGTVNCEKCDTPLADILDNAVTANLPMAQDKGLSLSCAKTDSIVHTDPSLLARIIENFVSNAIRYTDSGHVHISISSDAKVTRISIEDTGPGIPQESLGTVFDEYYQLDNDVRDRSKGLGLGLSIVKHLSRLLEHPVDAKSTLNKGSVFSVETPTASGSGAKQNNDNDTTENDSSQSNQATVLMVDDDTAVIDAMKEVMESFNVHVVTAESAEQALSSIHSGTRPDLLVTDFRMPGMNGAQLVQRVRAEIDAIIPAVIMTGDMSATSVKESEIEGCVVMHKPIEVAQLLSLLSKIKG